MSIVGWAWLISIVGAAAFLGVGWFLGKRSFAGVPGVPGVPSVPSAPSAMASLPPSAPSAPPVPPIPSSAPAPTPDRPAPGPRTGQRDRLRTYELGTVEGKLTLALRDLDPDRRLAQLILCDDSGLPIAAAEQASGHGQDAELLSAVCAEAMILMQRIGQTLDAARTVSVRTANGQVLAIRPLPSAAPIFFVSLGPNEVEDARFARFAATVVPLLDRSLSVP